MGETRSPGTGLSYWYAGLLPVPTKLVKKAESRLPPAFNGAEKLASTPEARTRLPGLVAVVAGTWFRIEAGTVNVLCPAVVRQMKVVEVTTALAPVPVVLEEPPMISTRSEALPPVQFKVRPALRVTVVGKPPKR